jgi:hypothetical protein
MKRLEHEKRPSKEALIHSIRYLMGDYKHERTGRFSASAIGNPFVPCKRAVVFGFAGTPQLPPSSESGEMMDHGTMDHLKWQIEGLTDGYMTEAEVWVHDVDLMVGGSIDAELHDLSLFELKTAGEYAYRRTVTDNGDVKYETKIQGAIYMLLRDRPWTSYVYENRSGGKFHEFRIERDSRIEADVMVRLHTLKAFVEADELPPMLEECVRHKGTAYGYCGYRKVCPLMSTVTEAQDLAVQAALVDQEFGRIVPDEEIMPDFAVRALAVAANLTEEE